jgi:hypothetical protein
LKKDWDSIELKESALGLQAQNLYLSNYLNKLEFLLQETVKERKRDKKKRMKELALIIGCVKSKSKQVGLGIDDQVMDYCKYSVLILKHYFRSQSD